MLEQSNTGSGEQKRSKECIKLGLNPIGLGRNYDKLSYSRRQISQHSLCTNNFLKRKRRKPLSVQIAWNVHVKMV